MSSFKKLNTKIYQKQESVLTPDNIYWKKFGSPVLVKEFGPIDYIDFSPIEPHYFAVTCSVRVQIYNPLTKLVVKNLSRFRECAYGAVFRPDGRLLCSGSEEATVKLFDTQTKSLLRLFKGHQAPVHRALFVNNQPQIVSFSDDKSCKLWDIATEKDVITFEQHNDYLRAGAISPITNDIILSGGYDNIVNMYDLRTQQTVFSVDHGSPIESLLFLPNGSVFLSAGGTDIKIWDILAGGKLLGSISQHHKTITCLRLATNNKRILSSSLDRHVKIYDIQTFKCLHTLDYPNSILSLGISKNDDTIAAGLTNGLVAISRRETSSDDDDVATKKSKSFRYTTNIHHPSIDLIVQDYEKTKETKYDHCLRKFEYSKALDCVLMPYVLKRTPEVTVSVIRELIRRQSLSKALQNRDNKSIQQILRFFIRNLTDYRFTRILIDAVNIFLDVYNEKLLLFPVDIQNLIVQLTTLIDGELELDRQLSELQGGMHLLLAASSGVDSATDKSQKRDVCHNLTPSVEAQKNLIVNLT